MIPLDLRTALRSLRRSPAFTVTAIAALSLGIGFNSTIFSCIHTMMLHPSGFADPQRIVAVETLYVRANTGWGMSGPDYRDLAEHTELFSAVAMSGVRDFNYMPPSGGASVRLRASRVTHGYFAVFGTAPRFGRGFDASHDQPGNHRVAVLAYAAWQRLFGGDTGVLGRVLQLDHENYQVIGILPEEFRFPVDVDLWVPANIEPREFEPQFRLTATHAMWARLRPGVSIERADAVVRAVGERGLTPDQRRITGEGGRRLRVLAFGDVAVRGNRVALYALSGAVLFVLLIAGANVAGLLVARGLARTREIAVRAALGAGRWQLMRQSLVESLLLGAAGAAGGLLVAYATLRGIIALAPGEMYPDRILRLDGWLLGFTAALGMAAGACFGLLPAWHAASLARFDSLRDGGRSGGTRQRLRGALVVAEVALALVLLSGAGMFVRSFRNALSVDPGFERRNLLAAPVRVVMPPSLNGESEAGRIRLFHNAVVEKLRALPGVENAAVALSLPLSGAGTAPFEILSRPLAPGAPPHRAWRVFAGPGYFETLGVTPHRGRVFTPQDRESGELVTIIDGTFARVHFGGRDPVGEYLRLGPRSTARIVGVVRDVRQAGAMDERERPAFYLPVEHQPSRHAFYLVRGRGADPAAVRDAVRAVDPAQAVYRIQPMESQLDPQVVVQQFAMGLLTMFAAVALFLAALGLYGVIAYSVAQRRREIGIRMALGARDGQVLPLIAGQGARLTLGGLLLGMAGVTALGRVLAPSLFRVRVFEPAALAVTVAALLAATALACWIPARRALRVDPLEALRSE